MSEIPGLETIRGLVGEPPKVIPIDREILEKQQRLMQEWNPVFIAVIPFCFKCKEPLVWHSPPVDEVLFHCPTCGRKWTQANWKEEQNDNSRRDG